MKSILYVGATLMIGASIYGFVDYNKTRNKKEFKNMYAEKEVKDPVEKKLPVNNNEKTEPAVVVKNPSDNKETVNHVTTPKKSTATVNKQRKRKFKPELFSRGALDEKYIKEEKIELPDPKTIKKNNR